MKMNGKISVAAALVLTAITGCVEDDSNNDNGPVLAVIESDDALTIEFYEIEEDGSIIVSEVGPAEVPSKLAALVDLEATPLEMYLALAQGDEIPIELEMHHASVTDSEPRDLSLSFRGYSDSTSSADCSATEDADWFDAFSTFIGWTDTGYWSGSGTYHFLYKTSSNFVTHLCNYTDTGGTNPMKISVSDPVENVTLYTLTGIDTGERGMVTLTNGSSLYRRFAALGPGGGQTNVFRQGYMVP
jgi:hypothetical protein